MWLLRSSPLDLRALLWSKYWVGTVPLLILGLILTGLTNALLEVTPVHDDSESRHDGGTHARDRRDGVDVGTLYPQFETENAAQIPTSFGGLVFMMATIALLAAVLGTLSRAVYTYVHFRLGGSGDRDHTGDVGLVCPGRRAVHGGHDHSAADGAPKNGDVRVLA